MNDLKRALLVVWLIVSAALVCAAAVPFVAGERMLGLAPACEARQRGSSCSLCGMTTAYVAIAQGDFAQARQANAGALPLWSGSLVSFAAAVFLAVKRRIRCS